MLFLFNINLYANCNVGFISPKKFEVWHLCNKYEIKWSKDNGSSNYNGVRIELYQQDILLEVISNNTENDGLFIWEIPEKINGLNKNGQKIRILDPLSETIFGESEIFLILDSCDIFFSYLLPVAANSIGGYNSNWKTEVLLENFTNYDFDYYLYFSKDLTENISPKGVFFRLEPLSCFLIEDIVMNVFNETGAGSIFISTFSFDPLEPPYELKIQSRTYSKEISGGTYGSEIFAIKNISIVDYYGTLKHLKETQTFRTNIGIVNLENYTINVVIKLYNKYDFLGEKIITLLPYEFHQENSIFKQFMEDPIEYGFAAVYPIEKNAKIFSYASVNDNITNDPSFIPAY